jgi:uncharacterized protein YceK
MRVLVIALALVLTGCGSTQAQSAPPPVSGGDFLPAYLDMLQGKKQVGDDLWCGPARDLHDLLTPCDTLEG